jgi:hypothetical protein
VVPDPTGAPAAALHADILVLPPRSRSLTVGSLFSPEPARIFACLHFRVSRCQARIKSSTPARWSPAAAATGDGGTFTRTRMTVGYDVAVLVLA